MNQTTCFNHSLQPQTPIQWYFYLSYFSLFFTSISLNIVFIHAFINYQKRVTFKCNIFNYLSFILIAIDLTQSIVLFFDIFLQKVTVKPSKSIIIEAFLSLRNCLLCCHAVTLLFMAVNRYRAVKYPLVVKDPNMKLVKVYRCLYIIIGIPFVIRLLMISIIQNCNLLNRIDCVLIVVIGIATAFLVLAIICIYSVLFVLLCSRNFKSVSKETKLFTKKIHPFSNEMFGTNTFKDTIKKHLTKSMKFAQVLFSITLLMIISYTPVFLTNVKLIKQPDQTIYYLFYLPALGDPLILMLSRDDIRQEIVRPVTIPSTTASASNTLVIQQATA